MSGNRSEDIRNVAVVGHKGAGKTALIEAMLYLAKVAPKLGKAGDRACGLDDSPEERAHMSTLESRLVSLSWGGKKVNLIDTPGETSLFADTRMALNAADAVLLVVSARSGVETGTERLSRWILQTRTPCLVVLTKVDDEHARVDEVIAEVRALKEPITVMEVPTGTGPAFRGVVDESTDDALTDRYLTEGDLAQREIDEGARKAVLAAKLVPVYCASSAIPIGIAALLDAIVDLLPSPLDRPAWKGTNADKSASERATKPDTPVAAFVFKTHIDPHAGKTSYLRVLSGTLSSDAQLTCAKDGHRERVAQLLQGAGKELKAMPNAVAGDLVCATKLKTVRTGETLSDEKHPFTLSLPDPPPPLFSRAVLTAKGMEEKVAVAIQRLVEEDPG